jgi:hypothetical protein
VAARALSREHEIAVRSSLGATWWRVVQRLTVENLMLTQLAPAVAIPVGAWTSRILVGFGPASPLAILADVRIDGRLIAAAVVLAGVTGLRLAFLPARVATRANVGTSLARRARPVLRPCSSPVRLRYRSCSWPARGCSCARWSTRSPST